MSPASTATEAWIALGSNLGDRRVNLEVAVARLARETGIEVLAVSGWHETEPVGGPAGQPRFLNGAARLSTSLGPRELLERLLAIEQRAGRDRRGEVRNGPRRLDLDLLFHGDARVAEPGLEVPHPRIEERAFVLAPLAELDPDRVLPASGRSVREALASLGTGSTRGPERQRSPIVRCADPDAAAAWCRAAPARGASGRGASIGFVPTMGALHAGHLELVRRAARENDFAVASVFVNPLQFNDPRDFARYPRDLDGDARLLEQAGAAMVFSGTLEQFFPGDVRADGSLAPAAWVEPGPAALGLEGEHRPGHFRGVSTIVARLFERVEPRRAYFGQKDYQQSLVVQDLAARRGGPEIVVCPTSREPSGLARSSRNQLLPAEERARAAGLFAALSSLRDAWLAGERRAERLDAQLQSELTAAGFTIEYAEVRDPEQWSAGPCRGRLERATALLAARITFGGGGAEPGTSVRLIDNLRLDEPASGAR